MSDVRQAARRHALELNRHRETFKTVAVVQQQTQHQIGEVKKVLKDVTGRTSTELYGPLPEKTEPAANALTTSFEASIADAPSRRTSDSASSGCQEKHSSVVDAVQSLSDSKGRVR